MEQLSQTNSRTQPVQLMSKARILVIRMGDMGDALLAAPLLRALRQRYPAARIDALFNNNGVRLLGECPHVDSLYTLPALRVNEASRLAQLFANLRRARYDVVIFANHLTLESGRRRRRMMGWMLNPCLTVGLDNGRGDFLNVRVPDAGFGARHEVEYGLALAEALDARLEVDARAPRLSDLGWRDIQPTLWVSGTPLRVIMHPGSGGYSLARRWPLARWAQLARAMHLEFGATVELVGGTEERDLTASIVATLGAPDWARNRAGATTPRELAETLAAAQLFIGNDSLPMHLATAAGIPVIAIFGPTNARAWGPYTVKDPERVAIIRRTDLSCSPCIYRGHELGTPQGCSPRPCLTELEIGPALSAARRLLRRIQTEPHA
jgi:heptosyltransferase-2